MEPEHTIADLKCITDRNNTNLPTKFELSRSHTAAID